jgi:hypothetical protein
MAKKHYDGPNSKDGSDPRVEILAASLMVSEIARVCRERAVSLYEIPADEIHAIDESARTQAECRLTGMIATASSEDPFLTRFPLRDVDGAAASLSPPTPPAKAGERFKPYLIISNDPS